MDRIKGSVGSILLSIFMVWVNRILIFATLLCLIVALLLKRNNERATLAPIRVQTRGLPEGSFGGGDLAGLGLKRISPKAQLPDLRKELVFLGINQRPDAVDPELFLALRDQVVCLKEGEPLYLDFDRESGEYRIGGPSNLWIVADLSDGPRFFAKMRSSKGEVIEEPAEHGEFVLKQASYGQQTKTGWQLGPYRVDNSLLARQKARWFGEDLFLQRHGGDAYARSEGRQKIDFGEGAGRYSCFLALGESLIWKEGKWVKSDQTSGYPLLHLRKLDPKLMLFDLWDAEGRGKISLSLMRAKEGWQGSELPLRFVAAKSWTQLILESGEERLEVAPGDWLIAKGEKLRKLESVEEVDGYVSGQLGGELLVIDALKRERGKQLLLAHRFSPARTAVEELKIGLAAAEGPKPKPHRVGKMIKELG